MRKLLWVLSFAVLFFSCGNRDTVVTAKRAFPQEKKIRAVRIPAGETMNPGHMLQKGDYLLIDSTNDVDYQRHLCIKVPYAVPFDKKCLCDAANFA